MARVAHFRSGAGAMGGTKKEQARRKRRETKAEEQQANRERA